MKLVSYDLETHLIQPGQLAPKAVVLSHCTNSPEKKGLILFPEALDWFEEHLKNPEVILVGHNQAYDATVCCVERPSLLPLVFAALGQNRIRDTQVIGKLIDIARGEHKFRIRDDGTRVKSLHSLAGMAKLYLGMDLKKIDTYRLRYHELEGIPLNEWPEEAKEYALKDAEVTLKVCQEQDKFIKDHPLFKGYLPNEFEQTRAAFVLHLMAVWGVKTDPSAVRELRKKLEKELEGADDFLKQTGFLRLSGTKKNPKWSLNKKIVIEKVIIGYKAQGLPLPMTKKGQVSTKGEVKIESGDPDLIKMESFESAAKLLSTYVPKLERGIDAPINANWNVLVDTGRTSCSEPNLQNPPGDSSGVRECFIPRPGYVYANADYSTVELRALAQICLKNWGFSKLSEVFNEGGDPHLSLAAVRLGTTLEKAKTATILVNGEEIPIRKYCKPVNFGFPGGMGVTKFLTYVKSYGFSLTLQQAEKEKEVWFNTWPEVKQYFKWIASIVPNDNATIKQYGSGRIRGGCNFPQAANSMFQGLAADGAKQALWLLSKECYTESTSPLFGSRPVVFLHDEFILEVPENKATEAADRMVELMKIGMQKWIPDVPICVSDPILMRSWSKKAYSVREPNGKLSVWVSY